MKKIVEWSDEISRVGSNPPLIDRAALCPRMVSVYSRFRMQLKEIISINLSHSPLKKYSPLY